MKMAGLKPNWRKMEKVIEMADEREEYWRGFRCGERSSFNEGIAMLNAAKDLNSAKGLFRQRITRIDKGD